MIDSNVAVGSTKKKVAPRRSHLGGAAGGLVGDIRFERIVGGMNGGLSRVEGRARLADSDGLARSSQVVTPSVQKEVPNVFSKKLPVNARLVVAHSC